MRRLLFLLIVPCLMAGKANAQVSIEIQGHSSFATDDLGRLADGTGLGGLVAVSYPVVDSGMLNLIGKVGFNQYGTKSDEVLFEGDIVIPIDSAYQGIPITVGARLYYDQNRLFYVDGVFGLEIKRGDFDVFDFKDETFKLDPVLSVGGGFRIVQRLAVVASFSMSNDLWRYANLGVSFRFGR